MAPAGHNVNPVVMDVKYPSFSELKIENSVVKQVENQTINYGSAGIISTVVKMSSEQLIWDSTKEISVVLGNYTLLDDLIPSIFQWKTLLYLNKNFKRE